MRTLTSNVALALDVLVDPFFPVTWVWVKSAVSNDPPMSKSFLFGVLIMVLNTVLKGVSWVPDVGGGGGISIRSDTSAANLEEAKAKADVAPNAASTAATTIIEMNFFMDVPPFTFQSFPRLVNCLVCPVQCTLDKRGNVSYRTSAICPSCPSPPFHSSSMARIMFGKGPPPVHAPRVLGVCKKHGRGQLRAGKRQ